MSVTLVYCCQTVGRIKMKLAVQVGLIPSHIVLDVDPGPPPQRGTAAPSPTIFGPYLDHIYQYTCWYIVAKWLDGSRCHLVWKYASAQVTLY